MTLLTGTAWAELVLLVSAKPKHANLNLAARTLVDAETTTPNGIIIVGSELLPEALQLHQKRTRDFILILGEPEQVILKSAAALPADIRRITKAIYSDPDINAQIALAQDTLGFGTKIAVPYTHDSMASFQQANDENRRHFVNIGRGDVRAIVAVTQRAEAVIITPDSSLYQPNRLRLVLMGLFQKNKVAVGYERNMVNAGAIAALYYDEGEIISTAREWLTDFEPGQLPNSIRPAQPTVVFNAILGKILSIRPPQGAEIYDSRQ